MNYPSHAWPLNVPDRFDAKRLARAAEVAERWIAADEVPAVSLVVGSSQGTSDVFSIGRQEPRADSPPLAAEPIFLIASPTKPIVSLVIMMLVEEGAVRLIDPVVRYVPEFAPHGKDQITLAQCLTHTSGLPDMPPGHYVLRSKHAPRSEFLAATCDVQPDFPAGRGMQYQSMGFLMLAEVAERVTGRTMSDLLDERIFGPLGMSNTSLGCKPAWHEPSPGQTLTRRQRVAAIRATNDWAGAAEHWNGDYWLSFGAPWGGILSTAADLGRLFRHLLEIHRGGDGIISHGTLAAMTRNQLAMMSGVPEAARRCYPWGYGWQLNWPTHPTSFGDLLSEQAYGHWGATGALAWIEPERDTFAVMLTTQPLEPASRRLTQLSNLLSAAIR